MSQSTKIDSKRDIRISKSLSYLLRHAAIKEKLPIDSKGYVPVTAILGHNRLKSDKATIDDIKHSVENNNKNRFNLKIENGQLLICANQGHSIEITDDNLIQLTPSDIPNDLFHETYSKNLASINSEGLKVMNRNHIHLTNNFDYIRKSCDTLIYIDIEECLRDGITFYKSLNEVYLTKGIDGVLNPRYFKLIDKRLLKH